MAIKFIANLKEPPFLIETGTFDEFKEFIKDRKWVQFDVETNVTDDITQRQLRSMQFGEWDPSRGEDDKEQWFLEWKLLTPENKEFVLDYLRDDSVVKVGHNIGFEAQVCRNLGVWLNNVKDTMIREKILYTGMSKVIDEDGISFFSLESVMRRRLKKELDKEFQTKFGEEYMLTTGHIIYGAQDVGDLDKIYQIQETELNKLYDTPVAQRTVYNHLPTLEDEAALCFADIMYNGMKLDKDAWLKLASDVRPIIDKVSANLKEIVIADEQLFRRAIDLGYYYREDTINIKFTSPQQKTKLFTYAFPDLVGSSKEVLKGWMKKQMFEGTENTEQFKIINELYQGDYTLFTNLMVTHCKDFLIENDFLIPAGSLTINWNSAEQVVDLLSVISNIDSAKKEVLENFPHEIAYIILDYKRALKLESTYGPEFLKHVKADGKVRTSFNQILETGRVSSSKPNMQQIPAYEEVGTKYRNCFIADEGFQYVDSDYSSQELAIIAEISKDPVWLEALRQGHDLHSVAAALVYKKKWNDAADEDCVFVSSKQKCNCKGHKRLRSGIKAINFGLAYGMSEYKLAADMKIPVKEARALIEEYFKTFPNIGSTLTQLGMYAVLNGHIMTLAPYKRKRFYPLWQNVAKYAHAHINNIRYNPILGSIERTGKNTPIQGTAADMVKLAAVMIRRFILQNKLQDKIYTVMQVHDQITTMCATEYLEKWPGVFTQLMERAAKVILPSGLLKAETTVSPVWTK